MEAKEKAKELVEKFLGKIPFADTKVYKDWKKEMNNKAKQCALIAVDEMINDCDASSPFETTRFEYWQQVKIEINNL
jgi:hypothetical protein